MNCFLCNANLQCQAVHHCKAIWSWYICLVLFRKITNTENKGSQALWLRSWNQSAFFLVLLSLWHDWLSKTKWDTSKDDVNHIDMIVLIMTMIPITIITIKMTMTTTTPIIITTITIKLATWHLIMSSNTYKYTNFWVLVQKSSWGCKQGERGH